MTQLAGMVRSILGAHPGPGGGVGRGGRGVGKDLAEQVLMGGYYSLLITTCLS